MSEAKEDNSICKYVVSVWDSENVKKKMFVKSFSGSSFKYTENPSEAKTYKYPKCALNCLNGVIGLYEDTLFGSIVLGRVVAVKKEDENESKNN